jgi:hypothetical protein
VGKHLCKFNGVGVVRKASGSASDPVLSFSVRCEIDQRERLGKDYAILLDVYRKHRIGSPLRL